MQWSRDEYLSLMTFGEAPRPMFVELFGPLIGLDEEWRAQGASPEELDLTAFDFDYVLQTDCGGYTGARGLKPEVISDSAEERVERDYLGRITRLCKKTATLPLPESFPVKDFDDWRKIKHFYTWDESRVDAARIGRAKGLRDQGYLVVAHMQGAFNTPRELMGEEVACLAAYEQPELLQDIMSTLQETAVKTFERVLDVVAIDQLSVHEDFAGRSGPLVGPNFIEAYFQPYYRAVWDLVRSKGGKIFQQDTDGNINSVMQALIDCGLTCVYPNEPAAGMNIVATRRQYGQKLALLGGIDKHVLRRSRSEIVAELEAKLRPEMYKGTVFGLDHRIPNGTPLENYRFYVRTAREMLGLRPLEAGKRYGWSRMAF